MLNKKSFRYILATLIILLAVSTVFYPVTTAFAGSKGQQIYFSCSSGIQGVSVADYVYVRGKNQYNQDKTWSGSAYWKQDKWSTFVYTKDYWWQGSVRVYWWSARTNSWNSGSYYIQPSQQSDVVFLDCRP